MNEQLDLPSRFAQHKLVVLICGTIGISMALVAIALWLYASSGTELLDLSRPGYQDVSKTLSTDTTESTREFSSTGQLDAAAMEEFQRSYEASVKKITSGDPFGGDALSPETLGLSDNSGGLE